MSYRGASSTWLGLGGGAGHASDPSLSKSPRNCSRFVISPVSVTCSSFGAGPAFSQDA